MSPDSGGFKQNPSRISPSSRNGGFHQWSLSGGTIFRHPCHYEIDSPGIDDLIPPLAQLETHLRMLSADCRIAKIWDLFSENRISPIMVIPY